MAEPVSGAFLLKAIVPDLGKIAAGLIAKRLGSALDDHKDEARQTAYETAWEEWWGALFDQLLAYGYSEAEVQHWFEAYQHQLEDFLLREDVLGELSVVKVFGTAGGLI